MRRKERYEVKIARRALRRLLKLFCAGIEVSGRVYGLRVGVEGGLERMFCGTPGFLGI